MSAPRLDVLAIQAEQTLQQVQALAKQISAHYRADTIGASEWAHCDAYLHSVETPLAMVRMILSAAAADKARATSPAAVAADPRA